MLDRGAAEALFLEHLRWIDKAASVACGRYGIWGAEAEDFTGWVRMRLMEDDYAVVRRYRGESELKTYLAAVVMRQFYNFDRVQRGRWRPSAAAMRLGTPAVDLEKLIYRDRYSLAQAGEQLRTAGRTTLSDAELARLLGRLPPRAPLRPVESEPPLGMDATEGPSRADERVVAAEADARRRRIAAEVWAALEQLDPDDRLIVRLHFIRGSTVAEVSRILGIEQKPLYRRVDRLRARLRELLERAGLSIEDVRDHLDDPDAT